MDVVAKNVHWLLPDEASPCDIFLHFRGQYAAVIPAGQAVAFPTLEKLAKAQCSRIYIRKENESAWNAWLASRFPAPETAAQETRGQDTEAEQKALYGNKRAELLSYIQKSLIRRTEGDAALDKALSETLGLLGTLIKLPTLDWYFQKFHEPPDLFQHCGRVSYALALFLSYRQLAMPEELEAICFSALIHELSGDPRENMKTVVSQQTLEQLEKGRHPVPVEVIQLIELHDELCSGKGFPNNRKRQEIPITVRAFTLFNHFDAYRLKCSGTRRARFDRTKELMGARQADYDPALWVLFWEFWEKHVEAVG